MKSFFRKYKHLASLALVVLAAIALIALGAPVVIGFAIVCLWQLSQFAMSKRCGMAFTTVLTPEQIKEFEGAVNRCSKFFDDNKENFTGLKDLASAEGGFAAIKSLPGLLKGETKRVDELQGEVGKLRKQLAMRAGPSGVRWVGNVPFVTEDCAKSITAMFTLECAKLENGMKALRRDASAHEGLVRHAAEILGVEIKGSSFGEIRTALTTTQIPLPTIYVPQIVELVFAFGQARQYGTVYPLGAGTNKLPRLAAGEDEFGYLGVGRAGGMSQNVPEKRPATELVTFDANKAGGLIRIPSELEEDTFIQLGQFLARYIARQMAKLEDRTMFIGDGTATYAEQVGVGKYCATAIGGEYPYLIKLEVGKTLVTDITLDNIRDLRGRVSAAILGNMAANGQTSAAYYCHPTLEPMLRKMNKYPNFVVFEYINGKPYLDGWPVRWIGVGATNSGAAQAEAYALFFGDLSYWYLGERGSIRLDVSKEVFFATDELALRALEAIDINGMAIDAMATLQLGAAA